MPSLLLLNGGQGTIEAVPLFGATQQDIEARTVILETAINFPTMTGKEFYPHPVTERNELHVTHPHGGAKVIIVRLMGTLFSTGVTSGATRERLVRTLLACDKNQTQHPSGMLASLDSYIDQFTVTLTSDRKQATIYFPAMTTYKIPPSAAETLSVSAFPYAILDQLEQTNVNLILGASTITIRQRAVNFETVAWPSPQKNFFADATQQIALPVSESELQIAQYSHYRIRIKLLCIEGDYECKFASDISSSATKRLSLAQGIFTHSQASSVANMPRGIESTHNVIAAMASSVEVSADRLTVTYIIPHLPNYDIPKGSVEIVTAFKVPGDCFYSPSGTGVDLVNSFIGDFTARVISVSAFYSGNFLVPETNDLEALWAPTMSYLLNNTDITTYVNDAMIRRGKRWGQQPFNVTITLVGQRFAADIVTNTDKRDRIIESILSPLDTTAAAAIPNGMHKFVSSRFFTDLTRVSHDKAVLMIRPLPNYALAAMEVDRIQSKDLPSDALEVAGYIERTGQSQVEIRARSTDFSTIAGEEFYGPGLTGQRELTDHDIRFGKWTTIVHLFGEVWRPGALIHKSTQQSDENFDCKIREAIFKSNKNTTEYPFGLNSLAGSPEITMTLLNMNTLKMTVEKLSSYAGVASLNELLLPQLVPGLCTSERFDAVPHVIAQISMRIQTRTAFFSGSFFSSIVSDNEVRDSTVFTVIIDLQYGKWAADVGTAVDKQMALLQNVFHSNREAGYPDYYLHGFQAQCYNDICGQVVRNSDTRLTVMLNRLSSYIQVPGGAELITAIDIPGKCLNSVPLSPIKLRDGDFSHTVYQRTAYYSGDFYTDFINLNTYLHKTNRYLQVDISYDSWASDLLTNQTKKLAFLHGVMATYTGRDNTTLFPNGIASYINAGTIDITQASLVTNQSIVVTIPPLPSLTSYPAADYEEVYFNEIPSMCLKSDLDVRVRAPGPYPGAPTARLDQFQTRFYSAALARYTGTFYTPGDVSVTHLKPATGEEGRGVTISLLGAKWAADVVSNKTKIALLLEHQFKTNKRRGPPDNALRGWEAMTSPVVGLMLGGGVPQVFRLSDTEVKVEIDKMEKYDLPPGVQEVIQAHTIPIELLDNATAPISIKYGNYKLPIAHNFGAYENIGQYRAQWAKQSSVGVEESNRGFGEAQKAVDMAFNLDFKFGDCIKTRKELNPWWRIELGYDTWVRYVNVITPLKNSILDEEYQNITVAVGSVDGYSGANAPCGNFRIQAGSSAGFLCAGWHGKYVTVYSPSVTPVKLDVCEIQIYTAGPRLSEGRPAQQSSTHSKYIAALAVDGNRAQNIHLGSCMHTLGEETPWWRVSLDAAHRVASVVIANRADAHGSRLSGAQVRVGDLTTEMRYGIWWNRQCGEDFSVAQGVVHEQVCSNGPIPGRFVWVSIPGPEKVLTMCEVEVFGTPCDANCFERFEVPVQPAGGAGAATPGAPSSSHGFCRMSQLGGSVKCTEPEPIPSSQSHVSTWGVDH